MLKRDLSEALKIIKKWEGFRSNAYLCPAGVWTIGYGQTFYYPSMKLVKKGDKIELKKASEQIQLIVNNFAKDVESLIKTEINCNMFCALVSFAYNVGTDIDQDDIPEGLGDSTLLKYVNSRNFIFAADEFLKWNKSKGKVLYGLTNRRKEERELFLK